MSKIHGIIAEFGNPGSLLRAAEKVRDSGFTRWDTYSPFPIHGMDQAMGMKRSKLGFVIGIFAFIGAAVGFGMQSWAHAIAYPQIIAGKPVFAWQAYIVITFAMLVLFGAIGSVFGMLAFNRLPRLNHPVFFSDYFEKTTDDGFFIGIDSQDPKFDPEKTKTLLESLGSGHTELLEGPDE
ncbi:MAG: DUF3341 domain-containing protein [FCB group bacterium]|nr:DUF3341 domain-containing protein [FCB group bacterium]